MSIMITPLTAGAAVQFPFELKDEFRKAFPSAKWNNFNRRWEVGSRSTKRLDAWVKEVLDSGVVEELEARDTADLKESEVSRLLAEIEKVKAMINDEVDVAARTQAAEERCVAFRAELEKHNETLKAAREARKIAEQKRSLVQKEVMENLATVADVQEIGSLIYEMKIAWRQLTGANRARFTEKQDRLKEIRADLAAVGIESQALDLAATANFNRPDRDKRDLSEPLEFAFSAKD